MMSHVSSLSGFWAGWFHTAHDDGKWPFEVTLRHAGGRLSGQAWEAGGFPDAYAPPNRPRLQGWFDGWAVSFSHLYSVGESCLDPVFTGQVNADHTQINGHWCVDASPGAYFPFHLRRAQALRRLAPLSL